MVIENIVLDIQRDAAKGFAGDFAGFREIFMSVPGAVATRLLRDKEVGTRFLFMLQWEDEAAQKRLESDERYQAWAARMGGSLAGAPTVTFYDEI